MTGTSILIENICSVFTRCDIPINYMVSVFVVLLSLIQKE